MERSEKKKGPSTPSAKPQDRETADARYSPAKKSIAEPTLESKRSAQSYLEQHERIDTFLRYMRESQNGNWYADCNEDVHISPRRICIYQKGSGWTWLIANDDVVIRSKYMFADFDDAALSLLQVLEGRDD